MAKSSTGKHIVARILILLVFASNMYCAISFFLEPATHVAAYQLSGEGAEAAIMGLGVAFAMWNATYLPILVFPYRFKVLFAVVIFQQIIGIAGETWIYQSLGLSQALLASSIMRFIIFDAVGLVLLVIAFVLSGE